MSALQEGDLLWQPTPDVIEAANLTRYMHWLETHHGLKFQDYRGLWQWSVTDIEAFWASLFDFFDLRYSQPWQTVLTARDMPGAQWFPGARLNYAENIFAKASADRPMLLYKREDQPLQALTWAQAADQVGRLAQVLREAGVGPGDRVVAYLPNIPEAVIAVLAVASLGAIWSSCAPDFGATSVLDRFTQIAPKVLIAVDGYSYNGKVYDRRDVLRTLQASLPSIEQTLVIPYGAGDTDDLQNALLWREALASVTPPDTLTFAQVPFDHPLWVLYSSGTTGKPKPIVQGHGGILLEHVKATAFHNDLGPDDRFFWYSSTGWMMWNYTVGALLSGATIILYDGSPAYPTMMALFELAAASGMTYFGTSAAFISACIKADIHPNQTLDLSAIRGVGSTGSPLTIAGFQWVYDHINRHLALESLSGGTDLCTAFVGGARIQPIYAGELQGASLGASVQAFSEDGHPLTDEVGELVITQPMPSMPLYFWGDDDARSRYRSSYFEMFPGIWRHGDWIKINARGGCVIYGRSDSTINRQGIRMGTSEIYRVVEAFDDVLDSLIIDLELLGRESYMPLFVVLREGASLTDDLKGRIKAALRRDVSPRHVPDDIIAVAAIPYTLSGKKMEVPIRKILLGMGTDKAANPGAMRNPDSLQFFIDFAGRL